MGRIKTRIAVVGIVVLGATALALAQGRAQFGYVDVRTPSGEVISLRQTERTDPRTVQFGTPGSLQLSLHLPPSAEPGSTVTIPVLLTESRTTQQGLLTLEVQEAGRFLSGTLHGTVGAWELSGGLRLARPATAAPPTALARQ